MPNRTMKPCAYPGCSALVATGYCADHVDVQPSYHNKDTQRLYNTNTWRSLRRMQLACRPWCEECLRANIYIPATDVDHVVPHHGDPTLFFSGDLQSLCHECHSRKTAIEIHERERVGV